MGSPMSTTIGNQGKIQAAETVSMKTGTSLCRAKLKTAYEATLFESFPLCYLLM